MADRWSKLTKAAGDLPVEFFRYARRYYPDFVASARPQPLRQEVPVFMFHSVERETFAAQMAFLHRNGYQTLSLAQFMDFLCGRVSLSQPAVLLTFDDGEKSLYHAAFPILQQYGFRAVVFVVGAYIREDPDPAPGKGWLAWSELAEMQISGLVEVQSHSYYHARIFTAPEVIDFLQPDFDPNPLGMDVPWTQMEGQLTNHLGWGAPVYRFSPNLSGRRRYLDSATVRQACTTYVAQHGGRAFFTNKAWRRQLRRIYDASNPESHAPQYESQEAQIERMRADLRLSRQVVEERLGSRVPHFCFPWGAGSELALKLCREVGFASAFWVVSGHRRSNRSGDDPYTIQRLKDDYLLRLPGQGRRPLLDIYQAKLRRRGQTLDLY